MAQYPESALTTSALMAMLVEKDPNAKTNILVSLTTQPRIGLIITIFKAANSQKILEGLLTCYAIQEHHEVFGFPYIIKPNVLRL